MPYPVWMRSVWCVHIMWSDEVAVNIRLWVFFSKIWSEPGCSDSCQWCGLKCFRHERDATYDTCTSQVIVLLVGMESGQVIVLLKGMESGHDLPSKYGSRLSSTQSVMFTGLVHDNPITPPTPSIVSRHFSMHVVTFRLHLGLYLCEWSAVLHWLVRLFFTALRSQSTLAILLSWRIPMLTGKDFRQVLLICVIIWSGLYELQYYWGSTMCACFIDVAKLRCA